MADTKEINVEEKSASTSESPTGNSPKPAKIKKNDENGKKDFKFPDSLQGFDYEFNNEGQLRNIKTGKPFEYKVKNDLVYNQKRYEALGEVITKHVYHLLESEGLQKAFIPIDRKNVEPQTYIFVSKDALSNPDKLMLFIHGSGVVRAGQWARRLIINDCLDSGTQLPYIKEAIKKGYGVMVLNTNDNNVDPNDMKSDKIRGSESPEDHVKYVWENFVNKAKARNIAIVAHSFGGYCTVELAKNHQDTMMKRVFAIALTDSVHNLEYQGISKTAITWLQKVSCNWVSNGEPLDVPIPIIRKPELPAVSAGDKRHEMTSWSSFKSVFRFLDERCRDVQGSEVHPKSEL